MLIFEFSFTLSPTMMASSIFCSTPCYLFTLKIISNGNMQMVLPNKLHTAPPRDHGFIVIVVL